MKLKDLPKGSKVFIDSNIFTYHLSGHGVFGVACRDFLKLVEKGEYKGYINDVVISEVLLNFLKSELLRLKKIEPYMAVKEIKKDEKLLKIVDFSVIEFLFERLRFEVAPSEFGWKTILRIVGNYALLPNDSIHLATIEKCGIENIATNDRDFERVEWLKVWKPEAQ